MLFYIQPYIDVTPYPSCLKQKQTHTKNQIINRSQWWCKHEQMTGREKNNTERNDYFNSQITL